jgi:hypothetical protein
VLRGNVNFTLATLVRLARAVGGEVRLDLGEPERRSSKAAEPVRWRAPRCVANAP